MVGMSSPSVRYRSYEGAATLRLTLSKYLTRNDVSWLRNAACTFPNNTIDHACLNNTRIRHYLEQQEPQSQNRNAFSTCRTRHLPLPRTLSSDYAQLR
jgi:hypothetical protein